MENKPNLIIELKRMGDLVLSFPLMSILQVLDKNHNVYVMAHEHFFKELVPIAPNVTFFSPSMFENLSYVPYNKVVNLSSDDLSNKLISKARATQKIGLAYDENKNLRINGNWALYKASLTNNSRHNRFHFSDLAYLDCLGMQKIPKIAYPQKSNKNGKIGIFIGASNENKRPSPEFWIELIKLLQKKSLYPVLLGGKQDLALSYQVTSKVDIPNMVGRFTLRELVDFVSNLELFITPDTGPMHVSSWSGVQCLNLSMGPVNAWETAPASPNHYILRPNSSCVSCWNCSRIADNVPHCHSFFEPKRIASLVVSIINKKTKPRIKNLDLMLTARDDRNLFALNHVHENEITQREKISIFWQEVFLSIHNHNESRLHEAISALKNHHKILLQLIRLLTNLQVSINLPNKSFKHDFWQDFPPLITQLSSYLQLLLENEDFSQESKQKANDIINCLIKEIAQ